MESNNMEWKTPPNPVRYKRGNVNWNELAQALIARPNEWALIAEDVNPSVVTHIRQGRLKAFTPSGSFEASGQGRNESGYTKEIYARFVGEGTAPKGKKRLARTIEASITATASATATATPSATATATPSATATATPRFIEHKEDDTVSLGQRAEEARTRFESLTAEPVVETADIEFMPAEYADDPEL